jgi:dihydroxyacetone kinase
MSALEMGAVVDETLSQLGTSPLSRLRETAKVTIESRGITPRRILNGPFMGSMNMPGISLTLLNLTNVSEETSVSTDKLLELLDAPHNTPAWPTTAGVYPLPKELEGRGRKDAWVEVEKEEKVVRKEGNKIIGMSRRGLC